MILSIVVYRVGAARLTGRRVGWNRPADKAQVHLMCPRTWPHVLVLDRRPLNHAAPLALPLRCCVAECVFRRLDLSANTKNEHHPALSPDPDTVGRRTCAHSSVRLFRLLSCQQCTGEIYVHALTCFFYARSAWFCTHGVSPATSAYCSISCQSVPMSICQYCI
jgi:hypothetical protein